jgi:hypothetical protein
MLAAPETEPACPTEAPTPAVVVPAGLVTEKPVPIFWVWPVATEPAMAFPWVWVAAPVKTFENVIPVPRLNDAAEAETVRATSAADAINSFFIVVPHELTLKNSPRMLAGTFTGGGARRR